MHCICSEEGCDTKVCVTDETLVVPFADGPGFHARVRNADLCDYVICTSCARKRVKAGEENRRYGEARRLQERFYEEYAERPFSTDGGSRPAKIAGDIPPPAHRRGEKQKRKKTPPPHVARYLAQVTD